MCRTCAFLSPVGTGSLPNMASRDPPWGHSVPGSVARTPLGTAPCPPASPPLPPQHAPRPRICATDGALRRAIGASGPGLAAPTPTPSALPPRGALVIGQVTGGPAVWPLHSPTGHDAARRTPHRWGTHRRSQHQPLGEASRSPRPTRGCREGMGVCQWLGVGDQGWGPWGLGVLRVRQFGTLRRLGMLRRSGGFQVPPQPPTDKRI